MINVNFLVNVFKHIFKQLIFKVCNLDWSQESEFPILIQFCLKSESEQNEIFFQWNETELDFFSWNKMRQKMRAVLMKWNQTFFQWDETESDFIFMRWDRTRNFFVKWDETEDRSSLNEMESSLHGTEHLILVLQSVYSNQSNR